LRRLFEPGVEDVDFGPSFLVGSMPAVNDRNGHVEPADGVCGRDRLVLLVRVLEVDGSDMVWVSTLGQFGA